MKKNFVMVFCLGILMVPSLAGSTIINYGNQTLTMGWTASHFTDVWNLMGGDLQLSYRIDLTGVQASATPWSNYAEVGIRQVGAGDFNPGPWDTYQGGAGGWMVSNVASVQPNNASLNNNDDHGLQASGNRGWADYDVTGPETIVAPFGTTDNYGMWFDRDGVDSDQAKQWDMTDGKIYNTGGIYDIVITYHAVNGGLGTMFATVNGIPTGFWTDGWKNAQPEIYPAGLSFKGDMTQMQVFYGIWGADSGGNVELSNISVSGTLAGNPVPIPGALWLLGSGLVGLVAVRRRLTKK